MKLTKNHLKKIIREEILKEGMKDDYKTFQQEVSTTQAGWKTRMTELDARQNSINSVRQAQTTIHELLGISIVLIAFFIASVESVIP